MTGVSNSVAIQGGSDTNVATKYTVSFSNSEAGTYTFNAPLE
jgi:hypothetical protein